ncbi:MAG: hypothetical protein AMXMBFR58_11360 [Phycisphaerae bacterium]
MSRIDHATTSPVAVDPLVTLRKRTRVAVLAGTAATVLAGVSALWPVSIEPLPAPVEVTAQGPQETEPPPAPPLDLAVFDGPIWLAPPPPTTPAEVAAKPAPPPPPLKLELLGILREGDSFKAVVYDPDTDKVAVLSAGDTLAGRTINAVTADTVAIKDGAGTRTLTLKQAGGTGGDG